jgi:hypothetical protein
MLDVWGRYQDHPNCHDFCGQFQVGVGDMPTALVSEMTLAAMSDRNTSRHSSGDM